MAIPPTSGISGSISFTPTEVKTAYTPNEFKTLLRQKHRFPPNIIVTGALDFTGWTKLKSLPKGLTVRGSLTISSCKNFISLTEELAVKDLIIAYCPRFTSLPERLTIGGHLGLSDCPQFKSLPNWITTLGPLANGDIPVPPQSHPRKSN